MASGVETIASGHGDDESSRDFECMLLLLVESIRCIVHISRSPQSPHGFISGHSTHSKSNELPEVLLYIGCQHHHYQPSLQGARTCALAFFNLASHFSDFQIPRSCFLIICHILHILYFCGLCKYFQHCKCKITTIKLTNL